MNGRDRRNVLWTLGWIAIFFATVAPTLSWSQFSGDSEDLVVQAVLEMRNGGPVWVPNLSGHPRIRKPPLTTWIAAACVSSKTIWELPSTDPATREAAYRRLAWEVRWPSLAAACIMLLAIAWTAHLIGGPAHVVPSVIIAATSLLFLRYMRAATTDVYLALWVTVANACLTSAIFQGRRWVGCIGGGIAVGLAFMSKGPAVYVESVLPFLVYIIARRRLRETRKVGSPSNVVRWAPPATLGILLMLLVSFAWPVSVLLMTPGSLKTWMIEIQGKRTDRVSRDPWFAYWALLPNMTPWLPIFVGGVVLASRRLLRFKPIALALCLVIVPIVALSFFHDRKERYLLPMIGPAAILTAHAAVRLKRAYPLRQAAAKWVWIIYWGLLGVLAVGLPLTGSIKLLRLVGGHWYSVPLAAGALVTSTAILATGIILQRRRRDSFIFTGGALMLLINALLLYGLTASSDGLSEMKPIADRIHADFPGGNVLYYDPPPRVKPVTLDLDIYLDQVVPITSDLPPSPAYDNAAAVVVLRKEHDPEPEFMGWTKHFDLKSRQHHWYVLERE